MSKYPVYDFYDKENNLVLKGVESSIAVGKLLTLAYGECVYVKETEGGKGIFTVVNGKLNLEMVIDSPMPKDFDNGVLAAKHNGYYAVKRLVLGEETPPKIKLMEEINEVLDRNPYISISDARDVIEMFRLRFLRSVISGNGNSSLRDRKKVTKEDFS